MKLYVFLTYGVSLKVWDDTGIFSREILLYKELYKHGVETTFVSYARNEDKEFVKDIEGVDVLSLYDIFKRPNNKYIRFAQSFIIPFFLKKHTKNADVFKSKQIWGAWVPAVLSKLTNTPYLLRTGYDYLDFVNRGKTSKITVYLIKIIFNKLYKASNHIIVATAHDKNNVLESYDVKESKISILSNWVDVDLFKPHPEVEKNGNRILFVGRLTPQKNLFMLIDAVTELNIGLDIIGKGELYDELVEYIKVKNADVRFLGVINNSDLPLYYNKYFIYILPSIYEGNPKTLIEAMSCQMAVIGADSPGINGIVKNDVNGLLPKPTKDDIKYAIDDLLKNGYQQKRLSANARSYVEKNHSLFAYTVAEVDILKTIMSA